ncbi:Glycosyl hydrolase family 92 [bacterium A37T11]|nr:Glycosyl hydrolase family 92 [bacterium A37T11]
MTRKVYPVTPGLPMYVIGSPVFKDATLHLGNGKIFIMECQNYAPENKFIQSVTLNGNVLNKSWFSHEQLMEGGKMIFVMGRKPNKQWASGAGDIPPSFEMPSFKL